MAAKNKFKTLVLNRGGSRTIWTVSRAEFDFLLGRRRREPDADNANPQHGGGDGRASPSAGGWRADGRVVRPGAAPDDYPNRARLWQRCPWAARASSRATPKVLRATTFRHPQRHHVYLPVVNYSQSARDFPSSRFIVHLQVHVPQLRVGEVFD